jgi:hypothetical protein
MTLETQSLTRQKWLLNLKKNSLSKANCRIETRDFMISRTCKMIDSFRKH